jgi:hypothetical protein
LGEQYRSLNLSLCSFLHSPVTLSLLEIHHEIKTVCMERLRKTQICGISATFGPEILSSISSI